MGSAPTPIWARTDLPALACGDRIADVFRSEHRRYGSEQLLTGGGGAGGNLREDGGLVVITIAVEPFASGENQGAGGYRCFDLLVQIIANRAPIGFEAVAVKRSMPSFEWGSLPVSSKS